MYTVTKRWAIVDDAKSNQPKAAMVQFKANHEQTKVSKLDEQNQLTSYVIEISVGGQCQTNINWPDILAGIPQKI